MRWAAAILLGIFAGTEVFELGAFAWNWHLLSLELRDVAKWSLGVSDEEIARRVRRLGFSRGFTEECKVTVEWADEEGMRVCHLHVEIEHELPLHFVPRPKLNLESVVAEVAAEKPANPFQFLGP